MNPVRICILAAALLAGCAGTPQQYSVKEVYVCAAEECGIAGHKYSSSEVLAGVRQLLRANSGQAATICESDPQTRSCVSVGACHFVQGGPIPGSGCGKAMTFSDIATDDKAGRLTMKAVMASTFIGLPVACVTAQGALSVQSASEITFELEPHYCNWMGVGNMTETFNFVLESVDLDRGQIGGYWNHAVVGIGSGSGSGYAIMKFPKGMPRGENWIADIR